ncbi:MAG: tetratricopeptide repeat protein, partial [Candidatus Binatia bacterium]
MLKYALTTIALLSILLVDPPSIHAQTLEARQQFASAYSFYSNRNFSQAEELFQQLSNANYPLADYALYHLAVIAFNESSWEASRAFLLRLRQEYPLSIWYDRAELQRIKIDIAEKKYSDAVDALRSLRDGKNIRAEISDEALYLQAQCQENQGDVYQAYSLFQELRRLSPLSRWTASARKDVARLREQYPDVFGLSTAAAIADEADRLTSEREHGAAEALYKKLLGQDLGAVLRLEHLSKLANLYLTVRKRNEAIPV